MTNQDRLVWQGRGIIVLLTLILLVLVGDGDGGYNVTELGAAGGGIVYALYRAIATGQRMLDQGAGEPPAE